MNEQKAVVVYSGGIDSFTLLSELNLGTDVFAISFNYGQRHSKELVFAASVCAELGIPHEVVDVTSIQKLLSNSALTSDVDVPEGHYEEESMKATVVPNRNMIMLSLAIGYAVNIDAGYVYIGAHAGDHAIYPDCRPEFINQMSACALIANYSPVHVIAPYINLSKGEIAKIGRDLGLDYGRAWTCYKGLDKPCGQCGACQERLEAMAFAGLTDPLEYADHA